VSFSASATFITDQKTHLVWQRLVDQKMTDHDSAATNCGNTNQRLPTYRELLTLVDEDGHTQWDPEAGAEVPVYIDRNAFPATPSGPFWTMSPVGTSATNYKVVDFSTGETAQNVAAAYYRCVTDQ
jgi:hypothetical protein